jgi:Ser/Thr protein kinase RdoA (MazF antagonist)
MSRKSKTAKLGHLRRSVSGRKTKNGILHVMYTDLNPDQLERTVHDCLAEHYGIEGRLQRLGGENLNFRMDLPSGERRVLKIVDETIPPEVVEMENLAIEHASRAEIGLEFPIIMKNNTGNLETRIKIRKNGIQRARLLTFLDGINFENVTDISIELLENLGKSVAMFDRAMESFDHHAAHRSHQWNLAEAGRHRAKVALVEGADRRELLHWAYDAWERQAAPRWSELPRQFIHGDLNRGNVVVSEDRVVGLLDFGDSCCNPAVCELAICLAYIMLGYSRPFEAAARVAAAYGAERPLSDIEQAVLYPLVCARLAVSVSIAAERKQLEPDHPNWFGSERLAWEVLPALKARGPEGWLGS